MTIGSCFSGIGGELVAATMMGWEVKFHCEINPFGRKVLQYWYPNAESYEDITKTDFSQWEGKINVLTGGFPCQPFSYAGKRGGAKDDRYLWPYMHKCIQQVKPDWVVCENVSGITSMVEQGNVLEMAGEADLFSEGDGLRRYQLRETFTLERISNDLESDGYSVQAVVIPACAVSAPHRRDRVFIVGCRYGKQLVAHTESNGDCGTPRPIHCEERGQAQLNAEPIINGEVRPIADTTSEDGNGRCAQVRRERETYSDNEKHTIQPATSRPCSIGVTSDAYHDGRNFGNGIERGDSKWQEDSADGGILQREVGGYGISGDIANPTNAGLQHGNQSGSEESEVGTIQGEGSDTIGNVHVTPNGNRRNTSDTCRTGLERKDESRSGEAGEWLHLRGNATRYDRQAIPNPNGNRGSEGNEQMESELADGAKPVSNGGQRNVADTRSGRLQETRSQQPTATIRRNGLRDGERNEINEGSAEVAGCGRWANFPTVSPVHRGNDGIPVPLEHLTIPFSKWRTESLKAYGNAIVPQVMYEIFRAIEIVEQQTK